MKCLQLIIASVLLGLSCAGCRHAGTDYLGGDIRKVILKTEGECVNHCLNTSNCIAVTFVGPNFCYLKKGGWTVKKGARSANMVSVDVTCIRTKQTAGDGTLSAWSKWSTWHDQGHCGPSHKTYYLQTRSRKRTCDGKSCRNDKLTDVQTRKHYACQPIRMLYIRLPNYNYAPTTGYLWMTLKQGSTECTTVKPTWAAPAYKMRTYYRKPVGCVATFDKTKKIDIWVNSDSSDDVFIDKMGVRVGQVWKTWTSTHAYVSVNSNENNGWYTTSS